MWINSGANPEMRKELSQAGYDCDPGFYATPADRSESDDSGSLDEKFFECESDDSVSMDEKFAQESEKLPVVSVNVGHAATQQGKAVSCNFRHEALEKSDHLKA